MTYRHKQTLFCPKPFEWFEIHPGGEVFLCCPAWQKKPIGNLLTDSIDAIWNGRLAVEIRKTIRNGSYHRCNAQRCPYLAGGRCFPNGVSREVLKTFEAGISPLPYGPRVLNLCFDLSCNLACPSCRQQVLVSAGADRQRAERLADIILDVLASTARELRLSGFGDPFASPVYRRLLREIGPQTFPELERLHLHSNGLLWDETLWRNMGNLHPYLASVEISADAADAATYRLNRGGDFEQLTTNLDFIATLPATLTLSCVIQANNYRQMPAFVSLAQSYNATAYFSPLVNWGTFSRREFTQRAVHQPGHPEHNNFLTILQQVSDHRTADLGSLRPLAASSRNQA